MPAWMGRIQSRSMACSGMNVQEESWRKRAENVCSSMEENRCAQEGRACVYMAGQRQHACGSVWKGKNARADGKSKPLGERSVTNGGRVVAGWKMKQDPIPGAGCPGAF